MPWHMAGGLENHAWDLARGMSAAGHDVHVLTTQCAGWKTGATSDPAQSITVHEVPAARPGRYSMSVFNAFARETARLDEQLSFDVLHAQGFAANAFPQSLASRLAITVHGTLTSETPLYRKVFQTLSLPERAMTLWRHKGRLASAPLFRRALRMARVLIVDSQFTQSELVRSMPDLEEKIQVVPLGIHPDRAPSAIDRSAPITQPMRILSVSRLTRTKGMHVALQAASKLRGGGWIWNIVGTGPELPRLRKAHEKLGLGEEVRLLGELAEPDLQHLRAQSDLFVYPELGYPAFGLVALEAMLSGMPVVASGRGAIPEVVGKECGWLVPGDDAEMLAQCINRLIAAPEEISAVAATCRAKALERFSFEAMIEKTLQALEHCCGGQ